MAKILLIVAQEGFQTKEYHDPRRVLERAGHSVVTGSVSAGIAVSNLNEEIVADVSLAQVVTSDYDGIFLIGGPGALKYLDNETTVRIMKDAATHEHMIFGAICVSPRILAKGGILSGKHATGWNGDGELPELFRVNDVIYSPESVVVDGRIVTADGPMSAEAFGLAIVDLLKS